MELEKYKYILIVKCIGCESTMAFCFQNCSELLCKRLLKFEAEGREFANFLKSLEEEQFIRTVQFLKQNAF